MPDTAHAEAILTCAAELTRRLLDRATALTQGGLAPVVAADRAIREADPAELVATAFVSLTVLLERGRESLGSPGPKPN